MSSKAEGESKTETDSEGEIKSEGEWEPGNQQESVPKQAETHTMATAAVQICPPDNFDFSNTANWPKWIRRFEQFRLASCLNEKSEEYQVNSLLYTLGDEADDILSVLPLSEDDKKKYDTVKLDFSDL